MFARCALLFAAVALLPAVAVPAHAAFPGHNGKIAFTTDRDGGHEIYTMNANGSNLANITNDAADDFAPAWSHDGTRIAFATSRDGTSEIYTMNADGAGLTNLTNNAADDRVPAWSPDGNEIVFATDRDDPNGEIYTMNADGTGLANITNNPARDRTPAWSPDGAKIAFATHRDGNSEIYTMNADGTGLTNLTNNAADDIAPDWSPDGTRIAFATDRDGGYEIYTMNADGTGPTNITDNAAPDFNPAWSPAGTKIAFETHRDGNSEIYTMNFDGTAPTNLTNNPALDFAPDWQPIPYTGYARPKAAFPIEASLVPAYRQCFTPNREHGPPLGFLSCNPPVQTSGWLTVGTADSNGLPIRSIGKVKYQVLTGDPSTPADEADVRITFSMTDVRNKADLTDYTGEVQIGPGVDPGGPSLVRITDRFNAAAFGGGSDPATVVDIPMPPTATCAATADPGVGGTCSLASTLDAFVPGMIAEGKRAIWQFGPIEVWDGGEDGVVATAPNDLFARQGVFVP